MIIKEKIFENELNIKEQLCEQIRDLKMKLRMPRLHMEFLKDNGKLEEFIEAKLTGKEATAKWLLLDNAQEQLMEIEKETARKNALMEKKNINKVMAGTFIQTKHDSIGESDVM